MVNGRAFTEAADKSVQVLNAHIGPFDQSQYALICAFQSKFVKHANEDFWFATVALGSEYFLLWISNHLHIPIVLNLVGAISALSTWGCGCSNRTTSTSLNLWRVNVDVWYTELPDCSAFSVGITHLRVGWLEANRVQYAALVEHISFSCERTQIVHLVTIRLVFAKTDGHHLNAFAATVTNLDSCSSSPRVVLIEEIYLFSNFEIVAPSILWCFRVILGDVRAIGAVKLRCPCLAFEANFEALHLLTLLISQVLAWSIANDVENLSLDPALNTKLEIMIDCVNQISLHQLVAKLYLSRIEFAQISFGHCSSGGCWHSAITWAYYLFLEVSHIEWSIQRKQVGCQTLYKEDAGRSMLL